MKDYWTNNRYYGARTSLLIFSEDQFAIERDVGSILEKRNLVIGSVGKASIFPMYEFGFEVFPGKIQ